MARAVNEPASVGEEPGAPAGVAAHDAARRRAFERASREYLAGSARLMDELASGPAAAAAARAGEVLADTLGAGGRVLFCGNGGSAADAQHLAAELVGRLMRDRAPLAGIALTTDTSALTAISNDYGYAEVFARQVYALGRPGDTLVVISTSGRSENVVRAAAAARGTEMRVVALLGPARSPLDDLADVAVHVPGETSGEIQQGHITVGHLVCALAESVVAPAGDASSPGAAVPTEE